MLLRTLEKVGDIDIASLGGKAVALARLKGLGFTVPETLCLGADAYRRCVEVSGLEAVVILELGRKAFEEMRWEELWDASLRIRNRFLRAALPEDDRRQLEDEVRSVFGDRLLVVRSSAPGEDSESVSFAGLHDSIVGVRPAEVVDAVLRVWSSLWSDRALLYRQELGLEVSTSVMAVVIQELVQAKASGVAFGEDPTDPRRAVVEAVWGLNQGLVDGTIEPDRWFLERRSGRVLQHVPPARRHKLALIEGQLESVAVVPDRAPLHAGGIDRVFEALQAIEQSFGGPQDVEWTMTGDQLVVLQARPVTTGADPADKRAWYLSLTRSFGNLTKLRERVERDLLPRMDRDADALAEHDLERLDDHQLADEIAERKSLHDRWVDVYWQEFIPFAHGVRLFGQFYNETMRPDDPYEFMDLLAATPMLSLQRNQALENLAEQLRGDPELIGRLGTGGEGGRDFEADLEEFMRRFGKTAFDDLLPLAERRRVLDVVLALAAQPPVTQVRALSSEDFLSRFAGTERDHAAQILEIARVSYQLRDDDNIHLAAIKAEVLRALDEGRRRLTRPDFDLDQVLRSLRNPNLVVEPVNDRPLDVQEPGFETGPRQIVGQPAGPGVAEGRARVLHTAQDLFGFSSGEVLVCDAVEPNMTFVVPLAAAVVERRGGMLIHGAIIAREYGLPCVTGVPDATTRIVTGDLITVDGYLGIVTVHRDPADSEE